MKLTAFLTTTFFTFALTLTTPLRHHAKQLAPRHQLLQGSLDPSTIKLLSHFNVTTDELLAHFNTSTITRNNSRLFDPDDLASAELWEQAKCKGEQFLAAMQGSDEDAGKVFGSTKTPPTMRSEWQGDLTEALTKWHWRPALDPADDSCDFADYWHIDQHLEDMGLSYKDKKDGGDNECWREEHGDPLLKDDKETEYPLPIRRMRLTGRRTQ
jgi:hypothetical protein